PGLQLEEGDGAEREFQADDSLRRQAEAVTVERNSSFQVVHTQCQDGQARLHGRLPSEIERPLSPLPRRTSRACPLSTARRRLAWAMTKAFKPGALIGQCRNRPGRAWIGQCGNGLGRLLDQGIVEVVGALRRGTRAG